MQDNSWLPPYSQKGTEPSFCARYGGLNEYLYSNFLWGMLAKAVYMHKKFKNHHNSAFISLLSTSHVVSNEHMIVELELLKTVQKLTWNYQRVTEKQPLAHFWSNVLTMPYLSALRIQLANKFVYPSTLINL